jgi:hypothetical protein
VGSMTWVQTNIVKIAPNRSRKLIVGIFIGLALFESVNVRFRANRVSVRETL